MTLVSSHSRIRLSNRILLLGALAVAAATAGCSDGESPEITNLSVAQKEITAGSAQTITGELDFADEQGDLSQFAVTVKVGDESYTTEKAALPDVAGKKSGKAAYSVAIKAAKAGAVTLAFVVYDAKGNSSNELEAEVTAK